MRKSWIRTLGACLLLLWLAPAGFGGESGGLTDAAPAPPRRHVVVLKSYHPGLPIPDSFDRGILAAMREGGVSIADVFIEHLDLARAPDSEHRMHLAELLRHKLAGKTIGVVIVEGPQSVEFLAAEGKDLFPEAAVVTLVSSELTPLLDRSRPLIDIPWRVDPAGTLRVALELFPATRRVVVVTGARDSILPFLAEAKKAFEPWSGTLEFEYTNAMTYEEMLRRIATLPTDAIVIYSPFFVDASGRSFVPAEVAAKVAQLADVPVFATLEQYLGSGIVGGSLLVTESMGKDAGKAALDYLNGRLRLDQPVTRIETPSQMEFDWRQLTRWRALTERLPENSMFIHRPASLWREHPVVVSATVLVGLLLSVLVASLLFLNRRSKRLEASAMASEARFRVMVERAPEAIVVYDVDLKRIVDANPMAERLFGCSKEKLLQGGPERFYPPRQPDGLAVAKSMHEHNQRALAGEEVVFERAVRSDDGRDLLCEIRLARLPYRGLRLLRASFQDITERKRIDGLLNFIAQRGWGVAGKDFLPALAERLGQLLQVDYVIINKLGEDPGMAETLGLYAHGAIAPNISYLLAGTPCVNVVGKQMCLYPRGVRQLFPEDRLLVEMKAESYLGMPLWDSAGRPIGLIAVLDGRPLEHAEQATTLLRLVAAAAGAELERLREEKLLRRERDRAQSYFDTVEAIIVALDRDGRIVRINRKGCQLLGWPEEALVGAFWFERCLPQPEGMERVYPYFLEMMSGGLEVVESVENEIVTRSGERRFIAWHNALLRDDDGEISGSLSAGEDITERKQTEVELEQYRHHLEALVESRTAELTEAKEAAEAANRAKSLFLANMSHEIRTPMNAVLGFAEILQGQENDPQKAHFIDGIYTSGRALLNLINDILDFSKIEAGKLELQHGAVSLSALFQEMRTVFGRKLADKGLIFTTEAAAELPAVLLLDETRLRQVLINLLGNALKYTERGSILLAATCRFETSESRSRVDLTLRVTDTGIGISTEHQKLIFEAFEQVRGRNQNQYGGTGLGLAISKRLVELMGGTLSVVSDVGRGSTFTVFLPGVEVAAGSGAQAAAGPLGPESLTFAPATILIADDIEDNREILRYYLAGWSFRLLYAENGQEVLAQAAKYHPDLILLDMKMPVMDGYACADRLKSAPELSKIPLVAVTASALKQDAIRISQHCDGYLSKPVSRPELLREVMRFLPHTLRAQAEAAASPGSAVPAGEVLTPQRLAALPEECRRQLHTALLQLDVARINALIAEIAERDPALGAALNALTEAFAFDRLQALLASAGAQGDDGI